MSPVPEDDIKDPVNEDIDIVENMEFPPVMIAQGISDSDDADEEEESYLGTYQLLPQDPSEANIATETLSNDEDSGEPEGNEGQEELQENQQTWRTSGPADNQQAHLAHYPDGTAPSYLQVADLPKPDKKDLLWNQAKKVSDSIEMDEGHADKIKAAMAGFKLPISHVPEWAKDVSDDQWNEKVVSQILSPNTSNTIESDKESNNASCSKKKDDYK